MATPPFLVSFIAGLLTLWLGCAYGTRLRERGLGIRSRLQLRQVPLIGFLLLILLLVVVPFLYLRNLPLLFWQLPLLVQYFSGPVCWIYCLGFLLFVFGTVWRLAIGARRWSSAAAFTLAIAMLSMFESGISLSPYNRPPRLEQARVVEGVIRQTSDASCAAAASANLLKLFGEQRTEAEMAELLGTTAYGTSTAQMWWTLQSLGYEVRKVNVEPGEFSDISAPALLLVDYGAEALGHVVLFARVVEGRAEIWDPLGGRALQRAQELEVRWRGHALTVKGLSRE